MENQPILPMTLDTVLLLRTLVQHSSISLRVWSQVDVEGLFQKMNFVMLCHHAWVVPTLCWVYKCILF